MLSYSDIKELLRGQEYRATTTDDFRVLDSYAIYDEESHKSVDEKPLKYLCYELASVNPETGEKLHFFKALKFVRIIRLPKSAKQSTSFMDVQQQILSSVYENNINLVTIIANIIKPNPIGLLFLYGVQGVGNTIDEAKEQADRDFVSLTSSLQGSFRVLEMRILDLEETEWLREKMYNMEYMTIVRGVPKANKAGEDMGNKGFGGKNLNPDSQGTLEEFITGMADYEYVLEVLSTPVYMRTLKEWSLQTESHMTDWNSQLQGSKSLSFSISMPMMFMANQGNSQGWSKAYTDADSVSYSTGESYSNGYSESVGQSLSQSFGESYGLSKGTSVTESASTSQSMSNGISSSQSIGESLGQSMGTSTTTSEGTSYSQNEGTSTTQSASFGSSHNQTAGTSSTDTLGVNASSSQNISKGKTNTLGENANINMGASKQNQWSIQTGENATLTVNGSVFVISAGGAHGENSGISISGGTGVNIGAGYGVSASESESTTASNGISMGNSMSHSNGSSFSESNGTSETFGTSVGHTSGESFGLSQSVSQGQSISNSVGHSLSNSQGISQSVSNGISHGTSVGNSVSESHSQSVTNGTSQNYGQSQSVSQGISKSTGTGSSQSMSTGATGAYTSGMSSSMGFGPSVGYNKGYQWMDQQVKDILELLEFQNERIKKSLRGEGAFYVYVYIACPSKDALAAASAVAKSTWQNEFALVNPLQVLNLAHDEQQHLLYHFTAFSVDVARETVNGLRQYKYSTVLLPHEYVAYCHLPRVSEGGVFADINDIPKFAVPSNLKGEIYMGTILSAERYTMKNGYMTPFDFRIDEKELMHGFFTGASRSGKTVAAMRFVAELANVRRKATGKRLRIVCLDPKQDWRTLARFIDPKRFRFFSLGNCAFRPIKINPFKIPKGVVPQTWIDGVIDIYCRAYGLLERGKQMMGETIYALYADAGVFDACDMPDWEEKVPELSREVTFTNVYNKMLSIKVELEDPNNSKGKAGNDTRDAYARLLDRLQCFSREFTVERKLFGTNEGIGIDELIGADDVTILESSGLEKTFKNFIFGVITSGFYKFAKAHEGGFLAEDEYETVMVIEEANEVLIGNDCAGSGAGKATGLGMSGQSEFEEILDQSAGYGLFIIAITQKIADMPKSIIANSGLVFAGRLKTNDDITVVMHSIAREEKFDDRDLIKWFPRMSTGMFVCQRSRTFDFKDSEPILVQIARLNAVPPSNLEIDEILTNQAAMRQIRERKAERMAAQAV